MIGKQKERKNRRLRSPIGQTDNALQLLFTEYRKKRIRILRTTRKRTRRDYRLPDTGRLNNYYTYVYWG